MNINYLLQHISKKLHTIIRIDTLTKQSLNRVCSRMYFDDHLEDYRDLLTNLLTAGEGDLPRLTVFAQNIAYITMRIANACYLAGPVVLPAPSASLPAEDFPCDPAWLDQVYHCTLEEFATESLLLFNLSANTPVSVHEFIYQNSSAEQLRHEVKHSFTELVFQNREAARSHNPYDQEQREITSIREGDLARLKASWSEDYLGSIGTLAANPLRDQQNLGIVLVTLASRAAIEGGVLPEAAFSLSDSYICKIEEAMTPHAALQLGRQAELHYAELVRDIKAQQQTARSADLVDPPKNSAVNPLVEECKAYIFTHLHEKIKIADIAARLRKNPNYLSDLFTKQDGISISAYILSEKINLAKNMLSYSHYTYSEIAAYLGFSSQSHLGSQFKKATGMTLRQYRSAYGVRNPKKLSR